MQKSDQRCTTCGLPRAFVNKWCKAHNPNAVATRTQETQEQEAMRKFGVADILITYYSDNCIVDDALYDTIRHLVCSECGDTFGKGHSDLVCLAYAGDPVI
jgi:hypothetical protein